MWGPFWMCWWIPKSGTCTVNNWKIKTTTSAFFGYSTFPQKWWYLNMRKKGATFPQKYGRKMINCLTCLWKAKPAWKEIFLYCDQQFACDLWYRQQPWVYLDFCGRRWQRTFSGQFAEIRKTVCQDCHRRLLDIFHLPGFNVVPDGAHKTAILWHLKHCYCYFFCY